MISGIDQTVAVGLPPTPPQIPPNLHLHPTLAHPTPPYPNLHPTLAHLNLFT